MSGGLTLKNNHKPSQAALLSALVERHAGQDGVIVLSVLGEGEQRRVQMASLAR